MTAHLLKVDVDGIVQDALAVRLVHHDQRVHLQQQPNRARVTGSQPNVTLTLGQGRHHVHVPKKKEGLTFSLETFACSSRC